MTTKRKYRNPRLAALHKTAAGLHRHGMLDKATMRDFDVTCLTLVEPLSPAEIVALRTKESVSQSVFAKYMNVAPKLVSEWERGEKTPSNLALKLLSLVKAKGLDAIA